MKIKKLTIAGFRGFNTERTIDVDDRLTVISARNSHGKTSISEALEFLIYGATSKVENADSKDEYRNSYRNRHYPTDEVAYIEVICSDAVQQNQAFRIELDPDGVTTRRFVDGKEVVEWPFQAKSRTAARPFVLQHALKYLLLVEPARRFEGFARLLGLNEVDLAFKAIIELCTKPAASVPQEAQRPLNELSALETRLASFANLKKVTTALKRQAVDDAYRLTEERADKILNAKVQSIDRLSRLVDARRALVEKVYAGDIALHTLTDAEASRLLSAQTTLTSVAGQQFLEDYASLCVHQAVSNLQEEANLLGLGTKLLGKNPGVCPLCKQPVTEEIRTDIQTRGLAADSEIRRCAAREESQRRVKAAFSHLKEALREHEELCNLRTRDLLISMQPQNEPKVAALFGSPNAAGLSIVRQAAETITPLRNQLQQASRDLVKAVTDSESAVTDGKSQLTDIEALRRKLQAYLAAADGFMKRASQLEPNLASPVKIFRAALDAVSGTAEISIVVDLIQKRTVVERAIRVRSLLEGLKDLKRNVEQTLAEMMDSAMNSDLTADVMKWYSKIKTVGDPEVHFSGFAMERTKTGDFKSRRLAVKAKSYGVELASAVSSLSESKLNALGLCVSIASAIRKSGPWSFLVIDDPIQSWDDEHEVQFIDVIRSLVETEHKQVLILTHNITWAKEICNGCRTLNGTNYEITGYTKDGPHMVRVDWSPLNARLREAEAIANDPESTSVRLQQAEEELRLAACQMASRIADEKLGRIRSSHNMNKSDVRTILIEAEIPSEAVDRIQAMFVNADDAHHAPKSYQPNIQRIRQALASLREVAKAAGLSLP